MTEMITHSIFHLLPPILNCRLGDWLFFSVHDEVSDYCLVHPPHFLPLAEKLNRHHGQLYRRTNEVHHGPQAQHPFHVSYCPR